MRNDVSLKREKETRKRVSGPLLIFIILALCITPLAAVITDAGPAIASADGLARAAVIDDFSGTVKATQNEIEFPAFNGLALSREDELDTGAESWSRLEIDEGQFAIIEENTNIQIAALADGLTEAKTTRIHMLNGKVWFDVSREVVEGESFEVKTPTCALSVRGTVFSVIAGEEETALAVYNGTVAIRAEKEDGTPLLDRHGNEVYMEVSSGKAKISVMLGSVLRVTLGDLTLEDLLPFLKDGGSGAGGVYSILRNHMSSNKNFMDLLGRGVNDMTPANIPGAVELLNGGPVPGISLPSISLPTPRFPW